jgi:hypothetical protein
MTYPDEGPASPGGQPIVAGQASDVAGQNA